MALQRVPILTSNYYVGSNARRLIVVHTAEGALTYQDLGHYFQGSVQASSHVGIDDTPGVVGEYVKRPNSSWTVASFNMVSLNAELCAFASWSAAEWQRHPAMLANIADWIAEESAASGIPIVRLTAGQAQGSGRGVCGHVDLGAAGGGHHDPGPSFPWDQVLAAAKNGGSPPAQEDEMILIMTNPNNNGQAVVDLGAGTYMGISSPDMLQFYKDNGVAVAKRQPTAVEWSKFKQAGTI